jgi:hypothetical protein
MYYIFGGKIFWEMVASRTRKAASLERGFPKSSKEEAFFSSCQVDALLWPWMLL